MADALRLGCFKVEDGRASLSKMGTTVDADETVGRFIQAWNTPGDAARLALLTSCCVPDALFISTQGVVSGVEAQSDSIARLFAAFPNARVLHGATDGHHGYVRFKWQTSLGDGSAPFFGVDVADLNADGLITRLASFDGDAGGIDA